jgi:hypothetical protein
VQMWHRQCGPHCLRDMMQHRQPQPCWCIAGVWELGGQGGYRPSGRGAVTDDCVGPVKWSLSAEPLQLLCADTLGSGLVCGLVSRHRGGIWGCAAQQSHRPSVLRSTAVS